MREVLLLFGRGLVKFLVSLFLGTGVGLCLFGYLTRGKEEIWRSRDPPSELFLGIGAGLLTAGAMLLLLFGVSWLRGRQRPQVGRDDWSFKEPKGSASREG